MREQPSPLLPILRSRAQGDILALLYLHPESDYTVAEVARLISANIKTVQAEISRLAENGFISDTRRGRIKLVRAVTGSRISRPLTDLLAVTYGPLPVLTELLAGIEGIEEAYIYGSWAARYSGVPGDIPRDIDVLVIGTPDQAAVHDAADDAEAVLRREVNISFVSPARWNDPNPADSFLATVRERPLVSLLKAAA